MLCRTYVLALSRSLQQCQPMAVTSSKGVDTAGGPHRSQQWRQPRGHSGFSLCQPCSWGVIWPHVLVVHPGQRLQSVCTSSSCRRPRWPGCLLTLSRRKTLSKFTSASHALTLPCTVIVLVSAGHHLSRKHPFIIAVKHLSNICPLCSTQNFSVGSHEWLPSEGWSTQECSR